MHNHFLDKGRRHLRLQPDQVELILPEHFAASYPKFLAILEHYYEFQEEEKATELLHHIFATRDITETDITLLSYIEDELLLGDAYFESFATGDAQKRAAANFSSTLFKSKGTKFAIQWFFRSFFGLDAEIVETQNQIFKLNEPESGIGSNSLKFLTDDKLYQTFAYLVRCSIPISQWRDLFKLFVHPAGMYLGGELLVTDQVFAELLTLDSDGIVTQADSPVISVTTTADQESEGTTFVFDVAGTNVPSIAPYNYYLKLEGNTSQADFAFSNDSVFPDSDNKRQFNLIGGSATINIPTFHDSVETESNESFTLFIEDLEGRVVDYIQATMENVVSSYTMTPSASTIDEGDSVQFSIQGVRVPNNGNTTLFYQVIPHEADSADDFESNSFPSSGLVNPVFIRDDSGSFSVQTKIDGTTEGTEHFSVRLYTEEFLLKDSARIAMNNVVPTFSVTPATVTVVEGEQIKVNLQVDPTTVGTTVDFTFDDGDDRILNKTGSFVITGTNVEYTLSNTSISNTFDVPPAISLTLTTSSGGFFSPELSDTIVAEVSNTRAAFTNVSTDVLTAGNGDTVVFTVEGTNIQNGNSGKYFVDLPVGGAVAADFNPTITAIDSASADNISFTSNSGDVSLTFAAGSEVGNEDFDFVVLGGDDSEVFRFPFTIVGNSTYQVTPFVGDSASDEGDTVRLAFVTDDTSQTDFYYYVSGTNITSDDFTSGYATSGSRGTVTPTIAGGDGLIELVLKNDQRREGPETLNVYVSASTTGGALAVSADVDISDTSLPVYTFQMPSSITEGDLLTATVTPSGSYPSDFSENVFVEFRTTSGDSVTLGTPQPPSKLIDADDDDTGLDFSTTTGTSAGAEGARTITGNLRIDSYGGPILLSDTTIVNDPTPSYTLTTSNLTSPLKVDDSADEGETLRFTFGGTNVPSGTYYYNVTDIKPKVLSANGAGSNLLLFDNDDNDVTGILTTGMEVREVDFPEGATIGSVFDNSASGDFVSMTKNNTEVSNISSGTLVYFANRDVFDDFNTASNKPYGSFTHTSGVNSTFDVELADSDDTVSPGRTESYTMAVTSDPEGSHQGGILVSRSFTIGDDDATQQPNAQRGTLANPESVLGYGNNATTAVSGIVFKSNGQIQVFSTTTGGGSEVYTLKGDWVDDTTGVFDASLFKINATITYQLNDVTASGSYGTDLNLSTDQEFSITTAEPGSSVIISQRSISFTITEIANPSNAVTTAVNLFATTFYINEEGEGRGLPE